MNAEYKIKDSQKLTIAFEYLPEESMPESGLLCFYSYPERLKIKVGFFLHQPMISLAVYAHPYGEIKATASLPYDEVLADQDFCKLPPLKLIRQNMPYVFVPELDPVAFDLVRDYAYSPGRRHLFKRLQLNDVHGLEETVS